MPSWQRGNSKNFALTLSVIEDSCNTCDVVMLIVIIDDQVIMQNYLQHIDREGGEKKLNEVNRWIN